MKTVGGLKPDIISYNSAITSCEKSGWWKKAMSLLREMPQKRSAPDVVSYNSAIETCGKGEE